MRVDFPKPQDVQLKGAFHLLRMDFIKKANFCQSGVIAKTTPPHRGAAKSGLEGVAHVEVGKRGREVRIGPRIQAETDVLNALCSAKILERFFHML